MNPAALKKILRFGLIGAIGCLAGWLVGEPFLYLAMPSTNAGGAPSLVSRSEPPPIPEDFKSRLDKAGGQSGDIQISLLWNNTNDLDLHCVDPSGWEISFPKDKRRSPTGGHLDVDRNAACNNTVNDPVENIYWPKGAAPAGEYRVFVNYYSLCGNGELKTPYKVSLLVGNDRKEFTGAHSSPQSNEPVTTFTVKPSLKIYPQIAEVPLRSGQTTKLMIEVERQFCKGQVTLKATDLPEGVKADSVTVPAESDRAEMSFQCESSPGGVKKIKIVATGNGAETNAEVNLGTSSWWSFGTILITAIWTALLAAGLGAALVIGQNLYLGRSPLAGNRVPLISAGSAAAGFASGALGQALQFIFAAIGLPGGIGYFAGWLVLGGLLGLGVSFFIPNLARNKAVLAGLAGGFLGVCAFLIFSQLHNVLGRFAGAAILGFSIGLMVALVEVAFRRAWLQVKLGPREIITVNLGPEPVKLGSDNRACTVWAKGAAPVAVRAFVRNGKVVWHDIPSNRETEVGHGHTETIGAIEVTVMTGSGPVPQRDAAPPLSPMPIPPPPPPVKAVAPPPPAQRDAVPPLSPPKSQSPPPPVMPPKPPVPTAPSASAGADACPTCGRKVPGRIGARYCMVCDKTF
jgi:hypothetical protein